MLVVKTRVRAAMPVTLLWRVDMLRFKQLFFLALHFKNGLFELLITFDLCGVHLLHMASRPGPATGDPEVVVYLMLILGMCSMLILFCTGIVPAFLIKATRLTPLLARLLT